MISPASPVSSARIDGTCARCGHRASVGSRSSVALKCATCSNIFHARCLNPPRKLAPRGNFVCCECVRICWRREIKLSALREEFLRKAVAGGNSTIKVLATSNGESRNDKDDVDDGKNEKNNNDFRNDGECNDENNKGVRDVKRESRAQPCKGRAQSSGSKRARRDQEVQSRKRHTPMRRSVCDAVDPLPRGRVQLTCQDRLSEQGRGSGKVIGANSKKSKVDVDNNKDNINLQLSKAAKPSAPEKVCPRTAFVNEAVRKLEAEQRAEESALEKEGYRTMLEVDQRTGVTKLDKSRVVRGKENSRMADERIGGDDDGRGLEEGEDQRARRLALLERDMPIDIDVQDDEDDYMAWKEGDVVNLSKGPERDGRMNNERDDDVTDEEALDVIAPVSHLTDGEERSLHVKSRNCESHIPAAEVGEDLETDEGQEVVKEDVDESKSRVEKKDGCTNESRVAADNVGDGGPAEADGTVALSTVENNANGSEAARTRTADERENAGGHSDANRAMAVEPAHIPIKPAGKESSPSEEGAGKDDEVVRADASINTGDVDVGKGNDTLEAREDRSTHVLEGEEKSSAAVDTKDGAFESNGGSGGEGVIENTPIESDGVGARSEHRDLQERDEHEVGKVVGTGHGQASRDEPYAASKSAARNEDRGGGSSDRAEDSENGEEGMGRDGNRVTEAKHPDDKEVGKRPHDDLDLNTGKQSAITQAEDATRLVRVDGGDNGTEVVKDPGGLDAQAMAEFADTGGVDAEATMDDLIVGESETINDGGGDHGGSNGARNDGDTAAKPCAKFPATLGAGADNGAKTAANATTDGVTSTGVDADIDVGADAIAHASAGVGIGARAVTDAVPSAGIVTGTHAGPDVVDAEAPAVIDVVDAEALAVTDVAAKVSAGTGINSDVPAGADVDTEAPTGADARVQTDAGADKMGGQVEAAPRTSTSVDEGATAGKSTSTSAGKDTGAVADASLSMYAGVTEAEVVQDAAAAVMNEVAVEAEAEADVEADGVVVEDEADDIDVEMVDVEDEVEEVVVEDEHWR